MVWSCVPCLLCNRSIVRYFVSYSPKRRKNKEGVGFVVEMDGWMDKSVWIKKQCGSFLSYPYVILIMTMQKGYGEV